MEEDTFHQFLRFYPTSDARSEPFPTFTSTRQIVSPSPQLSSPPLRPAPYPVKIKQGLWKDGEDFIHSSDWPPVQQYLSETSRSRRLAPAPTEIVFALAALEVLHQPHNPIHWLFWGATYLSSTSKTVNKIALHRPRLIKTDVPWIGISEYKRVISAIQEKWEYVHVRKRWYPVDDQPETSAKRLLRSSNDRVDQSINSYFNLPEDGEPPLKRTRRSAKKVVETRDPCTTDRAKRTRTESKLSVAVSDVTSIDTHIEDSPPALRVSSRKRHKTTSSTRSPATFPSLPSPSPAAELAIPPIVTSSIMASTSLEPPVPSPISSTSSSHSRNRSTSQSSAETLVDSAEGVQVRSTSVTSMDTAVEIPLSNKRKLEVVEECVELAIGETAESNREGMVTRGRASKFRLVETNAEKNVASSNTPEQEGKTEMVKPKPRAKKSRAKK